MKRLHYFFVLSLLCTVLFSGSPSFATTAISPKPRLQSPQGIVTVSGSGFGISEAVDIYLDTEDTALVVAQASGRFSAQIQISAKTLPGYHWLTAVGRQSGLAAQERIMIRTNWPQYRGGSARLGVNSLENSLNSSNVGDLQKIWYKAPYGTADAFRYSSPTVFNHKVYVVIGNNLFCFSAATGAIVWQRSSLDTFAPGGPAVAWCSSANYKGPAVLCGASKGLYALKASDGEVLWSIEFPYGASQPAIRKGVVYFVSKNTVYAVRVRDAAQLWSREIQGKDYLWQRIAVGDNRVFVCSMYSPEKLYALNIRTGTEEWNSKTAFAVTESGPMVSNGVVYIPVRVDGQPKLMAFEAQTGRKIWDTGASVTDLSLLTAAAIYRNQIYVGASEGLCAFDITGKLLWEYNTGTWVASAPTVAGGVVFFGCHDGYVRAVSTYGYLLWAARTGVAYLSSPTIVDGKLYVSAVPGNITAFGLDGRRERSDHRIPEPPNIEDLQPDFTIKVQSHN